MTKTHRMSGTRLHRIWKNMKSRCYNPNFHKYPSYGGRGVVVCDEWRDDFQAFHDWAQANGYDDELTLNRVDNDGIYEPANCNWATITEQGRNKRNSRLLTAFGETKAVPEWAEDPRCQVSVSGLRTRIQFYDLSDEEAIALPYGTSLKARRR